MAPDRTAACQSWICSPCCKSCVYGICAFVLRCFFSVLTLYSPMEHSLGVKIFFSSSLSSCKCCIFLTYPVFLFCLPCCHMYVVYVWTGGWLISLVLVTSDNKGPLLLLLLLLLKLPGSADLQYSTSRRSGPFFQNMLHNSCSVQAGQILSWQVFQTVLSNLFN